MDEETLALKCKIICVMKWRWDIKGIKIIKGFEDNENEKYFIFIKMAANPGLGGALARQDDQRKHDYFYC
eukprot:UN34514